MWDAALEAYQKGARDRQSRVSGRKRKFAALTLRMADMKAEKRLAEAMLRGENITELMAKQRPRGASGTAQRRASR